MAPFSALKNRWKTLSHLRPLSCEPLLSFPKACREPLTEFFVFLE
jgi:hypothetical protein